MKVLRLVAVSVIAILSACDRSSPTGMTGTSNPSISPAAVKNLMDLSLPDLQGKPQALSQWQGKVLVVNYWATWCAPCRHEMPAFSRLQLKYADNGVQFIGISIDPADKVETFQKETPVSYPLLIGTMSTMQTAVALGNANQGLPYTAIIDRDGNLVATKLGRLAEDKLEAQLESLLKR
jgi:thiol-disulfide isomerase/thioredoxin